MKQVEMWKWFKLPVDCEIIINADKTNSEHPDSISFIGHDVLTGHHIEKVEIAINSYDINKALIAKQSEQINIMRHALTEIKNTPSVRYDECSLMAYQALEATKEQA